MSKETIFLGVGLLGAIYQFFEILPTSCNVQKRSAFPYYNLSGIIIGIGGVNYLLSLMRKIRRPSWSLPSNIWKIPRWRMGSWRSGSRFLAKNSLYFLLSFEFFSTCWNNIYKPLLIIQGRIYTFLVPFAKTHMGIQPTGGLGVMKSHHNQTFWQKNFCLGPLKSWAPLHRGG